MARVVQVLLLLALCGCAGGSTSPGEPRRYSDDGSSSSDQCDLPVEQRTGGWFCYQEQ